MHHPARPITSTWVHVLFAALAILAMAVLHHATRGGLSVDDDGLCYVEGGRSISQGNGFRFAIPPLPADPVTHFPPLLSGAIAALVPVVESPYAAARWVNILSLGAQVWLAAWLVWKATRRLAPAGLTGLAIGLHVHVLGQASWAFSEPLFLALTLGTIAALLRFSELNERRWLIAAAFLTSAAALTRYSGVLWLALTPLLVLILTRGSWKTRLGSAVLAGVIAGLPWLGWSLRNAMQGGSAMNRTMGVHWISESHIREALTTISAWFLPWRFVGVASGAVCLALLLGGIGWVIWRSRLWEQETVLSRATLVILAFLGAYSLHLPLAISFLHFNTPLDERILLPSLVLMLCALGLIPGLFSSVRLRQAATLVLAAFVAFTGLRSAPWVRDNREGRRGMFGTDWQTHPSADFLRALPADAEVWSYSRRLLWSMLGRPIHPVPAKRNNFTTELNASAPEQLRELAAGAKAGKSVLVYIYPNKPQQNFSMDDAHQVELGHAHEFPLAEVKEHLALRPIFEHKHIAVFAIDGPATPQP